MVTINKILFIVMDDRGSKSAISPGIAVKEQRVYGYKYLHNMPQKYLRCILRSL